MLKDVIIVKQGKKMSVHSTLSKAYKAYSWNNYKNERTQRLPFKKEGYTIKKVPTGVSILCFDLLELMHSKHTVASLTRSDLVFTVIITGYNKEYHIAMNYDMDLDEVTKVQQVVDHIEEQEISTDSWTNQQIINTVNNWICLSR